jgi:RNA polymerase sigma factor (sigma-70 family)
MKSYTAAKSAAALTPRELVDGIRARDGLAWRAVTDRYEPLLRWLAGQCGLSATDAEDVAQLTWQRCLEHIDQLADPDRLGGWLATICRRECVRLATNSRRDVLLSEADMVRLIDARSEECDPFAEAARRDQCDRLYHAIMALPERQRVILVEMLRQEDESYLDLSHRLGLPVGSIGPTRQRAVTRLRLDPRIAELSSEYSDRHFQARSA